MTERLYPGGYSSFPPGMRHHLVHVTSQDSCDVTPEKLSFREIEFFPQTCQGLNLVGTQFVKTPHVLYKETKTPETQCNTAS